MGLHDQHFEHDEDIITSTQGVLSGEAFTALEKVKERPSADKKGYDFTLTCNHCSRPCCVSIPWEELAVASAGAMPMNRENKQPWVAHGGAMYPSAYCPCGEMLVIPLTPDKCQRLIRVGLQMGSVDPAWLQNIHQHVGQQLAAYRR